MAGKVIFWFVLLLVSYTRTQLYSSSPKNGLISSMCPHLYNKVFKGYVPRGNLSAGVYSEVKSVNKLKSCVVKCCTTDKCNVAFMMDEKCFHVSCASDELCLPKLSSNTDSLDHIMMVLVQPTDEDTWEDLLSQQGKNIFG